MGELVAVRALAVTVDYDVMENGRTKWPPVVTWRMVFILVDDVWEFDRYDH